MVQELPLDLDLLKAANDYAGRDETRYYLKGVFIEPTADGIYYVATNGHLMFVHREPGSHPQARSLIIPSDFIASYETNDRANVRERTASLLIGGVCRIKHLGLSREFRPIDGTFPKWRTALPKPPEKEEPAQFSGDYIKKLWTTSQKLRIGSPYIHHAGAGAAAVTFELCGDTLAVIMPVKTFAGRLPTWAMPATEPATA